MATKKRSPIKIRQQRLRKKATGALERPRLAVQFSGTHIYAQVIDDDGGKTLASYDTVEKEFTSDKSSRAHVATDAKVGKVGKRAKSKNVGKVVFDRGGSIYHGKVKALADAARDGGLDSEAIDKLTLQFQEALKAEMAKGSGKSERLLLDFQVLIEGRKVQLIAKAQAANAEKAQFDPGDAGRKLATQMQEAEGGAWTGRELFERFSLTPANLHKRRSEYRIVAWRDAKHRFHYPKWQFTQTGATLPGIQEVLQTFRSSDEWRVMRYFLAPRHQLGGQRPLDLLRAGKVKRVVMHAKGNGEENSW